LYPTAEDLSDVEKQLSYAITPECLMLPGNVPTSNLGDGSLTLNIIQGGVELRIKTPSRYADENAIDFVQILSRPTNLEKSQLINTLYPTSQLEFYYDFDTPEIICDNIEYTLKFYNKKYDLVGITKETISIENLSRSRADRALIGAGSSASAGY
jgi:hypothetical protein